MTQINPHCGECLSDPPGFDAAVCATLYEPPVSDWVRQLKFGGRMDRARIMAESLMPYLDGLDHTIPILPVPLHVNRLRSRGYNQAHEVAKIICRAQSRPLIDDWLIRVKDTAMQAELTEKKRKANVRQAFAVAGPAQSSHVIILDDVMTTGQTMRSITKCLKKASVDHVTVAVFARSGH